MVPIRLRLTLSFVLVFLFTVPACAQKTDRASRWIRCQQVPKSECILEEATALANSLEPGYRATALFSIASAMARTGRFDDALALAQSIRVEKYRSAAMDAIAELLAKAKRFKEAAAIAERISDDISRVQAHAAVSAALNDEGWYDDAQKEMSKALETLRRINDHEGRQYALYAIVSSAILVDRLPDLLGIAGKFPDPSEENRVYLFVAPKLAHAGRFDEALAMAEQIETVDEAGLRARFSALLSIAEDQLASSAVDPARNTLEKAYRTAEKIGGPYDPADKFLSLVKLYAKFGLLDEASRVVEKILIDDLLDRAVQAIELARIRDLLDAGRLLDAVSYAEEVDAGARGYNVIAIAFRKAGDVSTAARMMEVAIDQAAAVKQNDWRAALMAQMAQEHAVSGFAEEAKELFALGRKSAMEIDSDLQRVFPLLRVAELQMESGYADDAYRTIADSLAATKNIARSYEQSSMLHAVANAIYWGECTVNSQRSVELARRCIKM